MAIIVAGVLARAHIELLARQLPHLCQIQIFDLEKARIKAMQREIAPVLEASQIEMYQNSTPEEAIRTAQLIVPVTTTIVGYIA